MGSRQGRIRSAVVAGIGLACPLLAAVPAPAAAHDPQQQRQPRRRQVFLEPGRVTLETAAEAAAARHVAARAEWAGPEFPGESSATDEDYSSSAGPRQVALYASADPFAEETPPATGPS